MRKRITTAMKMMRKVGEGVSVSETYMPKPRNGQWSTLHAPIFQAAKMCEDAVPRMFGASNPSPPTRVPMQNPLEPPAVWHQCKTNDIYMSNSADFRKRNQGIELIHPKLAVVGTMSPGSNLFEPAEILNH